MTVEVYPIPSTTVYTLSGPGRVAPKMDLTTGAGFLAFQKMVANTELLKAILAKAAHEFALDLGEDVIAEKERARYETSILNLQNRSNFPLQETRKRRTF